MSLEKSMDHLVKLVVLVAVLFLASGCQRSTPSPPNLMHLILGALQTPETNDRDAAVASACRECARQGDGQAVLMGIRGIRDKGLHDEVAEECAQLLQSLGNNEAAMQAAEMITEESKRSSAISRLSAG